MIMLISDVKVITQEHLVDVTIDGRVVSLQSVENPNNNCRGCYFNTSDDPYSPGGCKITDSPTYTSSITESYKSHLLPCNEGERMDEKSIVWVHRTQPVTSENDNLRPLLLLDNKNREFRRVESRQQAFEIVNAACFGGDNGYSIADFTLIEYPVEKTFEAVTTVKISE